METTPWALYAVPAIVVLAVVLFGVSLIGQRLGAEQMASLRTTLEGLVTPGG